MDQTYSVGHLTGGHRPLTNALSEVCRRRSHLGISIAPYEPIDPSLVWRGIAKGREVSFAVQHKKILLAKFSFRHYVTARAEFVRFDKESQMAWKTPKIVEVPVGMEINMYACAARK